MGDFKNILVCVGLPRAGTTFLYTEISNYSKVFSSYIKESYFFNQPEFLINLKLGMLRKEKIYLDFTPDYIFNKTTLQRLIDRKINCFIVVREYSDYKDSLEKYLAINKIDNKFLKNIDERQFYEAVNFARNNFLTFNFNEVISSPNSVVLKLSEYFNMDFGVKTGSSQKLNSSKKREHFFASVLHNCAGGLINKIKAFFFGWV